MQRHKMISVAAALLVTACSAGSESVEVGGADASREPAAGPDAATNAAATAGEPARNEGAPGAPAPLLESSTPADGARLTASPSNLVLNFRTPVRLQEVTVAGSDGQTMPMMITAVGLTRSYSIPLPDLEPGAYSVRWRATDSAGAVQEGRLAFVVR